MKIIMIFDERLGHNMSKKRFWDEFYSKNNKSSFEWLLEYNELVEAIDVSRSFSASRLMLDIGCGSSTFSCEFQKSLRQQSMLICADFSRDALLMLKKKHESSTNTTPLIDYIQCDGRRLPFRDGIFDLAIDKGYLDSILKDANMKLAHQKAFESLRATLKCVSSRGVLFQITDEPPELRLSFLDDFKLTSSSSSNFQLLNTTFKQIDLERNASTYFLYLISKESESD